MNPTKYFQILLCFILAFSVTGEAIFEYSLKYNIYAEQAEDNMDEVDELDELKEDAIVEFHQIIFSKTIAKHLVLFNTHPLLHSLEDQYKGAKHSPPPELV
jgi:hypothetical protein